MTIGWSRRAVGHLEHLRAFIAEDQPEAAARVATATLDAAARLARQPNLGRPGRIAGTRELVVAGTPFLMPYRVQGGRVEILAVFHGRQQWPSRL
jgi:toxin ParE1/3/4